MLPNNELPHPFYIRRWFLGVLSYCIYCKLLNTRKVIVLIAVHEWRFEGEWFDGKSACN